MTKRNSRQRAPCLDLTPSVFSDGENSKHNQNSRSPSAGPHKDRFSRAACVAAPAGAVRRNPGPISRSDDADGSKVFGSLGVAALAIAGVAVWTTGSSQTLSPADSTLPTTLQAAIPTPAFFFDDKSDALERSHADQLIPATDNIDAKSPLPAAMAPESTLTSTEAENKSVPPNGSVTLALATTVTDLESLPDIELQRTTANAANPDLPAVNAITQPITGTIMLPDNSSNAAGDDTTQPDPETITAPVVDVAETIAQPDAVATAQLETAAGTTQIVAPKITLPDTESGLAGAKNNSPVIKQVTVKSGDTLSGILHRNGLKGNQLSQLFNNELVKEHLSGIELGQIIELNFDENKSFDGLTTRAGSSTRINIERSATGFDVAAIDLPVERKQLVTAGRIEQSLYLAAEEANLKQSTIMELANIFQWELDFARDIRQDDKFSLVYEQLFREGEYIGDGNILAAEFVRGGRAYTAVRFTDDNGDAGYYAPDGQSKRRTFMRHPVDVVRITSKFNPKRLHPVLHKIRAHRGVDYGSPHGSPIYATADGRVIHSGAKSAYGNTVILKHGEEFSTLYAHMSRISKKSRVGQRVKQGDVIGYVGKTGRVTGTHLHYEFRVNGTQIDPLTIELPAAAPLDKKYLPQLQSIATELGSAMSDALVTLDDQVATGPKTP